MMFRHSVSSLHPSARDEVGFLLTTTFQTQERRVSCGLIFFRTLHVFR